MGISLDSKYIKIDQNNARELKHKIESHFEKPKLDEDMEIDSDEDNMRNDSTMDRDYP